MRHVALVLAVYLGGCGGAPAPVARPAPAAQLDKASAQEALAAIQQVDAGHAADAIPVFQRLLDKYPAHPALVAELAGAYLAADQPGRALEVITPLHGTPGFEAQHYVVWGSALDAAGDPVKAQAAFDEGLARFPAAGKLYTNAGITAFKRRQFEAALRYFENGIAADPEHASNYYYAASLYSASNEKMWALIYGEVFMDLEPDTERTANVSKLLGETFQKAIEIQNPGNGKVGVSVSLSADANRITKPANGLPFQTVYELEMAKALGPALAAAKFSVTVDVLVKAREAFLTSWFADASRAAQAYPLFRYQREIAAAGHLDAYSHWLLIKADEAGSQRWLGEHQDALARFVTWFKDHPMKISAQIARTRQ